MQVIHNFNGRSVFAANLSASSKHVLHSRGQGYACCQERAGVVLKLEELCIVLVVCKCIAEGWPGVCQQRRSFHGHNMVTSSHKW
jgi:hypothetical protein